MSSLSQRRERSSPLPPGGSSLLLRLSLSSRGGTRAASGCHDIVWDAMGAVSPWFTSVLRGSSVPLCLGAVQIALTWSIWQQNGCISAGWGDAHAHTFLHDWATGCLVLFTEAYCQAFQLHIWSGLGFVYCMYSWWESLFNHSAYMHKPFPCPHNKQ